MAGRLDSVPGHVITRGAGQKRARGSSNGPLRLGLALGVEDGDAADTNDDDDDDDSRSSDAPSTPVIIIGLSGCVEPDDLARYRDAGMNGAIEKGALVTEALEAAVRHAQGPSAEFVLVNARNETLTPLA